MTSDERVEKARDAWGEWALDPGKGELPDMMLRAAFPDIYGETPTAVVVSAHDIQHAYGSQIRKVLTFEQAEALLSALGRT